MELSQTLCYVTTGRGWEAPWLTGLLWWEGRRTVGGEGEGRGTWPARGLQHHWSHLGSPHIAPPGPHVGSGHQRLLGPVPQARDATSTLPLCPWPLCPLPSIPRDSPPWRGAPSGPKPPYISSQRNEMEPSSTSQLPGPGDRRTIVPMASPAHGEDIWVSLNKLCPWRVPVPPSAEVPRSPY